MSVARPLWRLQKPGLRQSGQCLLQRKHYAIKSRPTPAPAVPAPHRGSLAQHPFLEEIGPSTDKPFTYTKESAPTALPRDPVAMAAKIDPRPAQRKRWERKMVIRSIQRRGRLSKTEVIKRTERELTSKSELWQTSTKKLGPLARQIAGKNLKEAMVQMQFSKKRLSKVILSHLREAELQAIVERGMGIPEKPEEASGSSRKRKFKAPWIHPSQRPDPVAAEPKKERPRVEIVDEAAEAAEAARVAKEAAESRETPDDSTGHGKEDANANIEFISPHRRITLKDGTRHTVWDPKEIYVAQAWVNKGHYGMDQMGRARGRVDQLRKPQSSISVLLKEEATRIREHDDREARKAAKKPWVPLPNKPITGQERPYYSW